MLGSGWMQALRRGAALCLALALSLSAATLPAQAGTLAGGTPAATAPALLEQAREQRFLAAYYQAIDSLQAALRLNPAYAPAWQELAWCHYLLHEYEQALSHIARAYANGPRGNELVNLEAFCNVHLGRLDAARSLFQEVAGRQSANRDARFGLALLDIAAGRVASARQTLHDNLRHNPRDARLLMALAIIFRAENRPTDAAASLVEALRWAGNDSAVIFAAAMMQFELGQPFEAERLARQVLARLPEHSGALTLLATLYFGQAAYDQALEVLDHALRADAANRQAWFLLGQVQAAAGLARSEAGDGAGAERLRGEAIAAFRSLLEQWPDDEIARLALENLVMDGTSFEAPLRRDYAEWRFTRAAAFERRFLFDIASAEYRRGLAIDPYANLGRRRYAELLRINRLPTNYFAELDFLRSIGKADQAVEDALEIYDNALRGSVAREWRFDPFARPVVRPYRLQVYANGPGGIPWHIGSDLVLGRYVRDLFANSSQVQVDHTVLRADALADAFRPARESGTAYFLMLNVQETADEILVRAELRSARTGELLLPIETVRSGNDRAQLAAAYVVDQVQAALPLQGQLLEQRVDQGLVNLGRVHGLAVDDQFILVRASGLTLRSDAPGRRYADADIVADLTVLRLDDEVCLVQITRRGFFNRVNPGDQVFRPAAAAEAPVVAGAATANPSVAATAPVPAASSTSDQRWPFIFEALRRLY